MTTDEKTALCEGESFTLHHPTGEYVTGLRNLADISLFFPHCEKTLKDNK